MKRSHGAYSKQSRTLKSKGRRPITEELKQLDVGANVRINVDPHFKAGRPHLRFNGKAGKIIAKRGKCYEVEVKDLDKKKVLCLANVHLVRT